MKGGQTNKTQQRRDEFSGYDCFVDTRQFQWIFWNPANICWNSTIEILEKAVKYVQS